MRIKDIEIGGEYYYDKYREWERYGLGYRVVVIDKGYKPARAYLFREAQPEKGGSHVLVDLYDGRPNAAPERRVVPATHLRGPWKETVERVEALRAQEKAAQERANEEWRRRREEGEQVALRAKEVLGEAVHTDFHGDLVVTARQMTRLLDVYEAYVRLHGEPAGV